MSQKIKIPRNFRSKPEFKKMKLSMSSKKISKDGSVTDMSQLKKRATIQRASQVLNHSGLMDSSALPNATGTERYANDLLNAMGYSVQVQQQEYTLVSSQIDFEPILNPSIADEIPSIYLNNHPMEIIKSFPNPFDPIYTPDEDQPSLLQPHISVMDAATAATLDLVNTANVFANMGLMQTKPTSTSRYFNNREVGIALKATKR